MQDGTPTTKTFEHVASEIGAEEAEEVGVEHLLRLHNITHLSPVVLLFCKQQYPQGIAAKTQSIMCVTHPPYFSKLTPMLNPRKYKIACLARTIHLLMGILPMHLVA